MEARLNAAENVGASVLQALPQRVDAIDALMAKNFERSVVDFRAAARAALTPGKSNAELLATQQQVHELLVTGIADFRALEFWLQTKVPQLSDGNNFGVEVQDFVIEKLKAMRVQCSTHADKMADYVFQRGTGLEKLGISKTTETASVENTETKTEDGKPKETKTRKDETTSKAASKEGVEDFAEYLVEVDVKHYVALEGMARDLASFYVRAHELVVNNRDKCLNPRGGRSGGGANSMY
eukprot:CAMPEP_0206032892 /NCGR_PEP_ID=MMETSP1466-20131121/278_1 /ASSEMBLY_ACC=CAM_ASM_001126 /TAXON_ID=44452 /ORGANISM="Pavlova gyrans, Strain CCMP608" /LENGTH=238 /DNA_ID=CAMNT_0053407047 /DNA_START=48 /DNA_END=764 /DNA_ORIENTATION=+